jgi:23S rRNA (cytidine1920-2'-O)/16S rRNA (cytidine1409-2'-O)-methyltransferase
MSLSNGSTKQRLDRLLHERGLAASREKAQALILAGQVLVNQQKIDKPGQAVPGDAAIELLGVTKYVSRGGLKLEAALDLYAIDPTGRVCADIGTSTGGFTDCLLQRGAARVHCVDVGPTQIDWKLRTDPRVILHEHLNARALKLEDLGERVSLAVCDVSFISVTLILPALVTVLEPAAEFVILVKPQFEVGREQVGKGGIVRDPELHQAACNKVAAAVEALGYAARVERCPLLGAEGNQEFLLYGRH